MHARLLGVRDAKQKLPGHHPTSQPRPRMPPREAFLLQGHDPLLDAYVAALLRQAHGRGVRPLRRLLDFKRTYPQGPLLAAVAQKSFVAEQVRRHQGAPQVGRLLLLYVDDAVADATPFGNGDRG